MKALGNLLSVTITMFLWEVERIDFYSLSSAKSLFFLITGLKWHVLVLFFFLKIYRYIFFRFANDSCYMIRNAYVRSVPQRTWLC